MGVLTLTTDFGEGSRYVAAMKGVILSINPDVQIVDLTHSVPPQGVQAGAQTLAAMVNWFPAGSVHAVVIDPGVGSDRRILYAEVGEQRFVLPDNGLLTFLADSSRPRKIVAIENSEFWNSEVSRTFHGRDIIAPVAARLSLGLEPDRLGPPVGQFVRLSIQGAERVGQQIEGEVVEVDSFGNLITNITSQMLDGVPTGDQTAVQCDCHQTNGIFQAYSDQPEMTLIALVGSTDQLELAIVNESAAAMLGVTLGTPVVVSW